MILVFYHVLRRNLLLPPLLLRVFLPPCCPSGWRRRYASSVGCSLRFPIGSATHSYPGGGRAWRGRGSYLIVPLSLSSSEPSRFLFFPLPPLFFWRRRRFRVPLAPGIETGDGSGITGGKSLQNSLHFFKRVPTFFRNASYLFFHSAPAVCPFFFPARSTIISSSASLLRVK